MDPSGGLGICLCSKETLVKKHGDLKTSNGGLGVCRRIGILRKEPYALSPARSPKKILIMIPTLAFGKI